MRGELITEAQTGDIQWVPWRDIFFHAVCTAFSCTDCISDLHAHGIVTVQLHVEEFCSLFRCSCIYRHSTPGMNTVNGLFVWLLFLALVFYHTR